MSGVILISTAEFALKSPPVRHQLVKLLKRHIRFSLKRIGLESCEISTAGGLLVVHRIGAAERVAKDLARVLGVAHADVCEQTTPDLSEIVKCTASLAERTLGYGGTFAVRARRFEPSPLDGKEIEVRAGAEILSRLHKTVKVNLDSPAHTFRVFFGKSSAFVSGTRFDGPDGLPIGSQGKLLGFATDSVYSPLSFYLLMKRGAMVWPVIPDRTPLWAETPRDAVLEGLKALKLFVPKRTFRGYLIEPDEDASKVLDGVDARLQRIFSIRLMFRVMAHLARTTRALGLVTGDSLGRGGLETVKHLGVFDEVVGLPVYRPLLALDEHDVNRQLEELGLAELKRRPVRHISPVDLSGDLFRDLRELEERVQAEQLARRIAASSGRISI